MALHEVQLKGYSVRPGNLSLGTFDSYGIEQLHVTLDDTWSGLAVTATFNPPEGEPVEIRAPENGLIDVPAEATANEGTGTIVYCGVASGAQRISKTQGYSVITHANTGTTVPFNPSESLATQVLQAALSAEQSSAEAKSVADSLRADAANGKFNGKDGAKGDKGDTGTTPQLKIGEDNLWHVSYDNGATWVSLGVKATGDTGAAGKDGVDGLTPRIGENGNWWIGNTDTGVLAKGMKGDTGAKGADGVSPTAAVTQTDDGAKFTVTDASGITTAVVKNGADGKNGAPGANGVSPTVQVETIDGGHRVTLTDASGAHAVDVLDGKPGKDSVVDATLTQDGQAADAKKTGEAIGQLKEDTAALQKRQNVLVGSETGNPVSCDDAFSAPLCGLHIYGKSTQDGTPTPDAPVPILSAGDVGSVVVKITGKNLLNPALFQNKKYQNFNSEAGFYEITENDSFWITGLQPCAPNTTYYLNKNIEGGCFYDSEKKPIGVAGFDFSFKTPAKCACFCVNFSSNSVNFESHQIIASFDRDPTYEPYHDEQLLTLQTPNGLPGIPVTSGGNYTDPTGQQWICDEVDLERGVKVQRVDTAAFDSTKTLAEQNAILAAPIETPLTPAEIAAYKALTTYAPDTVVQASDGAGIKLDYQRDVNLVIKNLEDAIASMTTT